jgi:hypothetical protein
VAIAKAQEGPEMATKVGMRMTWPLLRRIWTITSTSWCGLFCLKLLGALAVCVCARILLR